MHCIENEQNSEKALSVPYIALPAVRRPKRGLHVNFRVLSDRQALLLATEATLSELG
jgi:hypothetical protein